MTLSGKKSTSKDIEDLLTKLKEKWSKSLNDLNKTFKILCLILVVPSFSQCREILGLEKSRLCKKTRKNVFLLTIKELRFHNNIFLQMQKHLILTFSNVRHDCEAMKQFLLKWAENFTSIFTKFKI